MVTKVKIEGIERVAIVGDWFQDEKSLERLQMALSDVLEQCIINEKSKNQVQADSLFYLLRLIEALEEKPQNVWNVDSIIKLWDEKIDKLWLNHE